MAKCPKCKAPVKRVQLKCSKCGCELKAETSQAPKAAAPGTDTLNANDLLELQAESEAESAARSRQDAESNPVISPVDPAHVGFDTLNPELEFVAPTVKPDMTSGITNNPSVGSGTVVDPQLFQGSSTQGPAGAGSTSAPSAEMGAPGDVMGTVREVDSVDENNPRHTAVYNEEELRDVLEGKGASGTAGRLKRLWGSGGGSGSNNNPLNSLQGDEPLASDSLFKRVASRRVAQANAPHDTVADYIIVDKLGEGGMGVVYSARQTNVDRLVALKAIKASVQNNDDNRRKFFYEAQVTADLDHPNIVPIYELGASEDGTLFYAMKLVTGTEWSDVIRQKTREENLEILAKINDAIAFAHSKGIVHRDLKPANTMLGPYGEVYVTDWGMAIDTRKKKSFGQGGTPVYMAPEMATHSVTKIGIASDIYVLGALLFQILSGHPPHPGKTIADCVRAAARNEIIPYESDDPLLSIARRAMATDPSDRFASVEDFQEALREYRQHSESIALAHRSEEILLQAQESKDYNAFSRALFGYREAVELWPENELAISGIRRAQLEYGKCALSKADFDLAVQTLDQSDREQAPFYAQAVKGKATAEDREKRVRTLRRAIAVVVLAAVGVSSTLAVIAVLQANRARKEANFALTQQQLAEKKQKEAEAATLAEKKATDAAEAAKIKEEIAKKKAVESATKAIESAKVAEQEKMLARAAEMVAKEAQKQAEYNRLEAEENAKVARKNEQVANKKAAQIELGDFKSSLALAKSQLESFDVRASRENLTKLQALKAKAFAEKGLSPKTDTWPWQRVQLLSNIDLPKAELGSMATALDFAPAAKLGVVGTKDGQVHIVSYDKGELKSIRTHKEDGATIEAVAISPTGDEVVFDFKRGDTNGFRAWAISNTPADEMPAPVKAAAGHALHGFAYSADGAYIVAGINHGIWLWDRKDKSSSEGQWHEAAASKQYKKVRGKLKSLNIIDSAQAIVASQIDSADKLTLYAIDLNSSDTSRMVPLPVELRDDISAVSYDTKWQRLLLGTNDGRLYSARIVDTHAMAVQGGPTQTDRNDLPLAGGAQVSDAREILPTKHRTSIQRIVTEPSGQMLTISAEPVAHVWRRNEITGWAYNTYLTGTPGNILQAAFMGPGLVLGIDQSGLSIAWDVERQKQRRQLTRIAADGASAEAYASPVVGVFTNKHGRALAVDAAGVVDLWNLNDGKTIRFDVERWSYIGHTPGADFVDSAIDTEAGVVVTVARIDNEEARKYHAGHDEPWEFCVWDQKSGNMLRRWRSSARSDVDGEEVAQKRGAIEPRLSLVDHGRTLIVASDTETRLMSLDGQERFRIEKFGTYFAIPHPQQPDVLMLVKRSGAMRILDLKNLANWQASAHENALTTVSDTPLQGVWSPEGKRFYLTFTSGAVAAVNWNGSALALQWSSHRLEGEANQRELQDALVDKALRVKSHADVDMAVQVNGTDEQLYIARRARGARGTTELTVLAFHAQGQPTLLPPDKQEGILWLEESGKLPHLSSKIHSQLRVDNNQVSARHKVGTQTYITTRSANVFKLTEGTQAVASYGRQKVVDVTGNRDANALFTLLDDGSLWRFELSEALAPSWQRCEFDAPGSRRIQLSPDGLQLAVTSVDQQQQESIRVIDSRSGVELQRFEKAAAATWDPRKDARLAICNGDGAVELFEAGQRMPVANKAKVDGSAVIAMHYFLESWSDPKEQPRQHLVVQTESADTGYLQFVSLAANVADKNAEDADSDTLATVSKGAKVTTSPTEGVFATGDAGGSVKLWFASPTWDSKPKEIYELEGHRGAAIETVQFSYDGATLISTDAKNRVYGWLSRESNAH